MDLLNKEEKCLAASHAATTEACGAVEVDAQILELLKTSLDRVLRTLGLEMGAVWLHSYRVTHGLPEKAVEIGQAAAHAGLTIPQVQAVPDWQRVGETYPGLAPLAAIMGRLGIRASIAVSMQHEGRDGGLAVAASQPRE